MIWVAFGHVLLWGQHFSGEGMSPIPLVVGCTENGSKTDTRDVETGKR